MTDAQRSVESYSDVLSKLTVNPHIESEIPRIPKTLSLPVNSTIANLLNDIKPNACDLAVLVPQTELMFPLTYSIIDAMAYGKLQVVQYNSLRGYAWREPLFDVLTMLPKTPPEILSVMNSFKEGFMFKDNKFNDISGLNIPLETILQTHDSVGIYHRVDLNIALQSGVTLTVGPSCYDIKNDEITFSENFCKSVESFNKVLNVDPLKAEVVKCLNESGASPLQTSSDLNDDLIVDKFIKKLSERDDRLEKMINLFESQQRHLLQHQQQQQPIRRPEQNMHVYHIRLDGRFWRIVMSMLTFTYAGVMWIYRLCNPTRINLWIQRLWNSEVFHAGSFALMIMVLMYFFDNVSKTLMAVALGYTLFRLFLVYHPINFFTDRVWIFSRPLFPEVYPEINDEFPRKALEDMVQSAMDDSGDVNIDKLMGQIRIKPTWYQLITISIFGFFPTNYQSWHELVTGRRDKILREIIGIVDSLRERTRLRNNEHDGDHDIDHDNGSENDLFEESFESFGESFDEYFEEPYGEPHEEPYGEPLRVEEPLTSRADSRADSYAESQPRDQSIHSNDYNNYHNESTAHSSGIPSESGIHIRNTDYHPSD